MENTFWMKANDDVQIYVKKWYSSVTRPKAIIQLSHGMAEHIGRYEAFAHYLVSQGFVVYGNDHRGHGQTGLKQGLLGYLSDRNGFTKTMEDLHMITLRIRQEFPNTPLFLFGHSMGSFLSRLYIEKYSDLIKGVILSGTGYFPAAISKPGKTLAALLPPNKQSKLMNQLAFGNYNSKIKENKTIFDWLTRDNQEVQKYLNDPLSGFVPTAKFFVDLMSGIEQVQSKKHASSIRKGLPMLFISGTEDPVGNHEKGVWKSVRIYEKSGIENITTLLFDGARHELINEINKKEVFTVIENWIRENLKRE
ncbi:alpha/beta hydrolase [Oceanobacillus halophilus]|uniref:Alpha/beta hydrolase n=2 Tax=Oceanobacillus halophilus TaxID=930130 RepID=A0A495ABT9_9BACI|nr:alpha/beta hydrolase [Oceanobacillus halophilus]